MVCYDFIVVGSWGEVDVFGGMVGLVFYVGKG